MGLQRILQQGALTRCGGTGCFTFFSPQDRQFWLMAALALGFLASEVFGRGTLLSPLLFLTVSDTQMSYNN